jgi:dTDP-4-dehydrorhamnose reductase
LTIYLTQRITGKGKTLNLLVTGASGLLGRAVMNELKEQTTLSVTGTAFRRAKEPMMKLDLTNCNALKEMIRMIKPGIIIHAAAERRPDVSQRDPDYTRELNVTATRCLATAANEIGAWVVYMSTDYVFDGAAPPYAPGSKTNPLNFYGKSKLDGERALWDSTSSACVLRVPVLYGAVESLDESPITVIAKDILKGVPQKIDNWAIRYPTLVDDVAFVIRQIIEYRMKYHEFGGTYHWSADEPYTKYGMAKIMAPIVGAAEDKILAEDTPPPGAPRPKDSHLDCSELESLGIGRRSPFQSKIESVLKPFVSGSTS